jgi:hypothetical protein
MDGRKVLRWVGLFCILESSTGLIAPSRFRTVLDCNNRYVATRSALFVAERQADVSPVPLVPTPPTSRSENRVRRLRDLMWVRETLEDLTAAEFAINLDQTTDDSKRRKRAVDYDNLLAKLDSRMRDLACDRGSEDCQLDQIVTLTPGKGMASTVYSDQQRTDLFK